ncbi:MAG: HD domain-containing protein [Epulopiscium sp.]|jgi:putative hydrolase of HD superfamily|nr:HD domain-containing protein [Candidatus Epulonipiscium sp.]
MTKERLAKQMNFILEIDKAKNIFRQTYLTDGNRKENDAEHSWHLAIMAFVLAEYFEEEIDVLKVMKMVLMHDIVEIDAGDTYCYDDIANLDKAEREQKSAQRIYGILPEEQGKEYLELWEEFEEGKTKEANFAAILDRLHPIMLNLASDGKAWLEHNVDKSQVLKRNERTLNGPEEIAEYFLGIIDEALKKGYLTDKENNN